MIPSKRLLFIALALVFMLACGLTPTAPLDYNAAATAVAQTVQAASAPASATGLVPVTVVSGGPSTQAIVQATPTAIPTKSPPTQAGNQPSSKKLTITSIVPYPTNVVYFGNCQAGEITLLNVQATLDPLDQVKSSTLYYNLVNFSGRPKSFSTQMWQLGIGDYAGDIDLTKDAPAQLGDKDGMVEFWIEATDKNGATVRSNVYSLSVYYCPGSALGPPPVAISPKIIYFNATGNVQPGESIHLEWSVENPSACGVTLNGDFVEPAGWRDYPTTQAQAGTTITYTLRAIVEPCNNPTIVSEEHTVSVSTSSNQQASPQVIAERYQAVIVENYTYQWDLDTGSNAPGELKLLRNAVGGAHLTKVYGGRLSAWNNLPGQADCLTAVTQAGWTDLAPGTGQYICYSTDKGNIGYMYIESILLANTGQYEMTFTFITWKGP